MDTKNIYLLVGESGNGKTSVSEHLERQYGLTSIQSYTTRPKRSENETGHIFITDSEFDNLKDLVAYTEFNNYRYGTTTDQVEQHNLYVIDPAGVEYFKTHYTGNKQPYVIYIYATLKDRILRMIDRGDSDTQIVQRLINDVDAFQNVGKISDTVIVNDDLVGCVNSCYQYIIEKEMTNE